MFTTRESGWTPNEGIDTMSRHADRWEPAIGPRPIFDPVDFISTVWRARWPILLAGVAGGALAAALALATPKEYTAYTQLILDPRALNLVQNDVTPNAISSEGTLALIQSQIAVVTSNNVLSRVIAETGLTQDPEYNGTRATLLERTLPSGLLVLLGGAEDHPVDRDLVTLLNLRQKISAGREANSYVINLSAQSEDPAKAAQLANLTAETFIAEQGRAQSEIAGRASADLSSRLNDLRERVGDAESAVEAYIAENQLVGVGGRLITDEYITRINNQLADARAQITALSVRAESMRNADVDDVVQGAFPEELTSESLVRLRQSYADLNQQQSLLAAQLGPRHPQRISGEQALGTARRAIASELSRIVASAQTELQRAEQTERDLTGQIATLRGQQLETSGAFVELRELERNVDASRAVYENYLLRARELAQQESLNTVNVRTISEATVPFSPSSTSRRTVVLLGIFAGLALGFAIATLFALVRGFRLALADRPALVPAVPGAGYAGSYVALPGPRRRFEDEADVEDEPRPGPSPEERADVRGPASVSETAGERTTPAFSPLRPSRADPDDTPMSTETESGTIPPAPSEPEIADTPPPAVDRPAAAAPKAGVNESARERRDRLRARIREIAARHSGGTAESPATEGPERPDAGPPQRRSIAELRRRRAADKGPPAGD